MKFEILHPAWGALALILSVSACSGHHDSKQETTLSAFQVCDSTLDSSAVASLQRMGATEKFSELPGTDDVGHANKFSLRRAAGTLHDDITKRNQCDVFKSGDKTGHSLIEVDFSASRDHPSVNSSSVQGESENTLYPIGVYAKVHARTSATLYFKCTTYGSTKTADSTPYVRGYLYSTPDQASPNTTGKDLMVILNSISRSMAKQLGCASQAALPSRVPST
ncbi:hypothetical protein [Streptomyces sp. MMG1121]|uniref:hypothetical protein n=1 Tax=Streptomyces sp. MMG1121 TaxID=1415544 RepID=UPI00131B15B3|nr:hypothetical protein [Streptomyces sp. MMG1121]